MSRDFDPLDVRAQEAAESQADDAKRLQQQIDADDFLWLMSDKRGRRLMWRQLLEPTGVFRNPFTGNSETYFRCGEMNVGQRLMAKIHELCPEQYHLMVKEQQAHVRSKRPSRDRSSNP